MPGGADDDDLQVSLPLARDQSQGESQESLRVSISDFIPEITTAIALVYRLVCGQNSLHLQCSRETVRATCPAGIDSLQELLGEWVQAFGATICQW